MEDQSFDILEEKINRIISKMNRLKVENEEIKQENQILKSNLEKKDEEIKSLATESAKLSSVQNDIVSYKENQDRIRSKVDVLLQKLKDFDDIQ